MYKETFYTIGNPLECDEYFMETTSGYFETIEQAKSAIERRVKFDGCRYNDYEIAKVSMVIERGVK